MNALRLRTALGIGIAMLFATASGAQTASENIARAQQTVADIEKLLDAIHAHVSSTGPHDAPPVAGWQNLFDGKSLTGWKRTEFTGGGGPHLDPNFRGTPAIVIDAGNSLSGINWTGDAPRTNYEIALEAIKIDGADFMCGLTFPVGSTYASLILGGWGGTVVGISSINGQDASDNETSQYMSFDKDRWYAIRLRVTPAKLQAWVDGKQLIDCNIKDKKISLRFGEISKSVPIGLSNYQTKSAFRNIRLKRLASDTR